MVKNQQFLDLVKSNSPDLPAKLKLLSDSSTGVTICYLYDFEKDMALTSNNDRINLNKLFGKSAEVFKSSTVPVKSFEAIPFDRSIFNQVELSIIGTINDSRLIVYSTSFPFKIGNKSYLLGSFTVLNNNKVILDKIYNTFTYDTALFSAISYKEKVITTNSTPKNIFFLNLNLPSEMIDKLNKNSLVKGIYNIDNEPTAVAAIPLKSINGEIVGGLSIAANLKKLEVIISEFKSITTAIVFSLRW